MVVRAVPYNPALNPLSATHSGVAPPSIVDGDAQDDGDTAHHPPPTPLPLPHPCNQSYTQFCTPLLTYQQWRGNSA